MRALTLSAIVGGLLLAGIIITAHSCNSNPKPDVTKPSVDGSSGHDSGTVTKIPKPDPNTIYPSVSPIPLPKPQPQLHQQTPIPKPSPTAKPLDSSQDRSRVSCYVVRIPVSSGSSSSPPTITPIHCN